MPSTALAESIRRYSAQPHRPAGPEDFLREMHLLDEKRLASQGNVWQQTGSFRNQKAKPKPKSKPKSKADEERELEARIAAYSAKFEPLRAQIVKLLVDYGWEIDPSPKNRIYGVLELRRAGFWMIVETSGFQRLYEHLQQDPEAWGWVAWMDTKYGPLPLPYYLTQSMEEDMTMKLLNEKMDQVLARLAGVEKSLTAIETTGKVLAWVITILTGLGIGVVSIMWAFFDAIGWDRVLAAGRIIFT